MMLCQRSSCAFLLRPLLTILKRWSSTASCLVFSLPLSRQCHLYSPVHEQSLICSLHYRCWHVSKFAYYVCTYITRSNERRSCLEIRSALYLHLLPWLTTQMQQAVSSRSHYIQNFLRSGLHAESTFILLSTYATQVLKFADYKIPSLQGLASSFHLLKCYPCLSPKPTTRNTREPHSTKPTHQCFAIYSPQNFIEISPFPHHGTFAIVIVAQT